MLEARYEAPDIHIIPPMIGRVGKEAVGSVDAGFSDRAWTLPHRVDLVRSLNLRREPKRHRHHASRPKEPRSRHDRATG